MNGLAIQDERLGRRVGAIVLIVTAIAIALVIAFLDRLQLHSTFTIEIAFHHAGALREGAPVIVAGREIGVVRSIALAHGLDAPKATNPARSASPRFPPDIIVLAEIESRFAQRVPGNGEFFISTRGLLGDKFLEIGAPARGAMPAASVTAGTRVRGVDPPQMDRVLIRAWSNLAISKRFLDEVGPEAKLFTAELTELATTLSDVAPTTTSYAKTAHALNELVAAAHDFSSTLEEGDFSADRLHALNRRASRLSISAATAARSLNDTLSDLELRLSAARDRVPDDLAARIVALRDFVGSLQRRLPNLAARAAELAARVERGQGTIGSLLHDPEFSDDAKELGKTLKRHPWRVFGNDQR